MAFLTVKEIADALGTDAKKVGDWIASGELAAINIARNPRGARPRWRILASEWERFLAARQSQPPAPTPPRKKRKDSGVTQYYS
jgi:excisionase family DNA binding protein